MQDPKEWRSGTVAERPIPLFTAPEVCDLLGISMAEFRRRRTARQLPGLVRLPNGGLRVLSESELFDGLGVAA